jgi:hypothetical protein
MTVDVEVILEGGMGIQEALRGPRCYAPSHLAFPSMDRQMRVFYIG